MAEHAQANATTQPMPVQPSSRLSQKIAHWFGCWRFPATIDGRKYKTNTIRNVIAITMSMGSVS